MAIGTICGALPIRHAPWHVAFSIVFGLCCASRAVGAQSEFAPSHKNFADYVHMGFDIKGTWGSHVVILQKGDEVAFCDVISRDNLYVTIREGCVEMNRAAK